MTQRGAGALGLVAMVLVMPVVARLAYEEKWFWIRARLTPRRRRVVVESPYAGDVAANAAYARRAMHDSVRRGEAPFLSHLLYTQGPTGALAGEVGNKSDPAHWITREEGLECASAWRRSADAVVFYVDRGWSGGMRAAKKEALRMGLTIEERAIGG
jgi:hypothetical protein